MRKFSLVFILSVFCVLALGAQTVQFEEVVGRVQYRNPGASWVNAQVGQTIDIGATISTGFGARASVNLAGNSLEVTQMTRVTVRELSQSGNNTNTRLDLETGRIRARVRSSEGATNDFQLRSSRSTAAVRGTDFEYSGFELIVYEGLVAFFNRYNQERPIGENQASSTDGSSIPTDPEAERLAGATASANTGGLDTANFGNRGSNTGGIIVIIPEN
jgi:ferric-dicitrate binding protein FerR (iron transport regulator)